MGYPMSTETVYYVREGKKYKPVSYYDSDICNSFPAGASLVVKNKNSTMRRHNIDIDYAPVLAAMIILREELVDIVLEASKAQEPKFDLTDEQRHAWENLISVMGESARSLTYKSSYEVCENIVERAIEKGNQYFKNPVVQSAYQQFLIVYELTKEQNSV